MTACEPDNSIIHLPAIVADPRAFTLLELVITLGIIALLSAVVVFSVRDLPEAGRVRARAMEEAVVQKAVAAHSAGDDATPLDPRPAEAAAPICASDADAPFARYLRTCTTYEYWWDVQEDNGVTVTLHQVE
jgi:prepilin-type N-terminal cleavage/methylation domain-containing protein